MPALSRGDGRVRSPLQAMPVRLPGAIVRCVTGQLCADSILLYKICRFCHNHIRQNLNNKCPACRREYSDEALQEKPVSTEECVFCLFEIRWGGPLIVCIATLQPPPTCAAEEAARARAKGSRRAWPSASGECTRRAAQRRVRRRHRPALCQGRGTFHEQMFRASSLTPSFVIPAHLHFTLKRLLWAVWANFKDRARETYAAGWLSACSRPLHHLPPS